MKEMLGAEIGERAEVLKFRRGAGCSHCNGTGYHSRIGIFEFLEMDENLVRAMNTANPLTFAAAARKQAGFRSLRHSAIAMAAQGYTTMAQVLRATFGLEE